MWWSLQQITGCPLLPASPALTTTMAAVTHRVACGVSVVTSGQHHAWLETISQSSASRPAAAACCLLPQVQKGSVVVFLRFDSINQIVFDSAEPRSILISCRDERRCDRVVWWGSLTGSGLTESAQARSTTCQAHTCTTPAGVHVQGQTLQTQVFVGASCMPAHL